MHAAEDQGDGRGDLHHLSADLLRQRNEAGRRTFAAYAALVNPFAASIAPALQACASSPTYYYEASDGPAITTGMNALFASSEQAARLLR